MLHLTRIEEGACYVTDTTNFYVAWSMLYLASKLFWGAGIIKDLDQAKSLSNQAFGDKPESFSELINLLENNESPVLDTVRIIICFENYFKAKMLLDGYAIHQMDLKVCRQHYPQFVTANRQKVLLQKTTPILMAEVKNAEKLDEDNPRSLKTLTKQTLSMNTLLEQPRYQALYLNNKITNDKKLLSILRNLNYTRNTLHFLNIEYIIASGMSIDDFVFLQDYVTDHSDALVNKMQDELWKIDIGKDEIEHLLDSEFDDE